MKIYEYIREENEKTAKLFGFTIMSKSYDYMAGEKYQSFLGGLITTVKLDASAERSKKDIKLLGHSITQRIEENNFINYYFLNKKYRSVSLINAFKKQYFKYFDNRHDDIYILRANSGEIYLTLTYVINYLIKKNNSKRPLLAATQKYHVDMIKMICPDIPYVYIGNFRINIVDDIFKINNFRFFMLYSSTYFKQTFIELKSNELGKWHYFRSILNRLNMTENDIEMNEAHVLPEAEKSMLEKINKTGLNLDKFVFLAPEAQTFKLYDENFWCLLINKFQDNGYDVYVNLVEDDIKLKGAIDYKKCDLSFAEVFALAKRAKKIVSLRSGFTEFLLQTGTPMDVLYTKTRNNHDSSYHIMSGCTLSELPFADKTKIREFNMFEVSQIDCLNQIITIL